MNGNNVVGIIFSNMHDEQLPELTAVRTMGSVPFGGRYRMIDFPLSNMVNSGITKVGVVTKSNYQSLMDHLGSGKSWDLSRKREGLFILPPFGTGNTIYHSRLEALAGVEDFLSQCKEEYVVLSDCNVVCTMDIGKLVDYHIEKGADITMAYNTSPMPEGLSERIALEMNAEERVEQVVIGGEQNGSCNWSFGVYVIGRKFLLSQVSECVARGRMSFSRNILQGGVDKYKIIGWKFNGFTGVVGSLDSYYDVSMSLMDKAARKALFSVENPIYTKVRDEMPTRYGLGSKAVNCLVADGCLIEGEVENCIIFRGVRIGKGAKLKNCIIMQDTVVEDNVSLSYVVADKDVVFGKGTSITAAPSSIHYVPKGKVTEGVN